MHVSGAAMASMTVSSAVATSMAVPALQKCSAAAVAPIAGSRSPPPSASPSASSSSPQQLGFSRRLALPLLGLSLLAGQARPALAKDIPLFGIRKRVEQAEKEVVQEVKELVKEGEQLVVEGKKEVVAAVKSVESAVPSVSDSAGSGISLPPLYQAGAVAGAEVVAVLVASSVVSGLVSES